MQTMRRSKDKECIISITYENENDEQKLHSPFLENPGTPTADAADCAQATQATTPERAHVDSEFYNRAIPVEANEELDSETFHVPGSSISYVLLGLILLFSAVMTLVMPQELTRMFFKRMRPPFDILLEELWRILGATLLACSTTTFALKRASDARILGSFVVQRLQMGMTWFSFASIIIALAHVFLFHSIRLWGLLTGCLIIAPSFLLPGIHLGLSGGFWILSATDSFKVAFQNVFSVRKVTLAVLCYSLLTVISVIVGGLSILAPQNILSWTFGQSHYNAGEIFLWQLAGSGMLFLFPSMYYTCLERSLDDSLWQTLPRIVNVGIFLSALFNILEYGSLVAVSGVSGRWMLLLLLLHWVLALLTSVLGMTIDHDRVYEVLPSA